MLTVRAQIHAQTHSVQYFVGMRMQLFVRFQVSGKSSEVSFCRCSDVSNVQQAGNNRLERGDLVRRESFFKFEKVGLDAEIVLSLSLSLSLSAWVPEILILSAGIWIQSFHAGQKTSVLDLCGPVVVTVVLLGNPTGQLRPNYREHQLLAMYEKGKTQVFQKNERQDGPWTHEVKALQVKPLAKQNRLWFGFFP